MALVRRLLPLALLLAFAVTGCSGDDKKYEPLDQLKPYSDTLTSPLATPSPTR